jgi:16S rRNA processing protein RimM
MVSNPTDNLLVVGKVGAPYGVKGWVKITAYTDDVDNVFEYQPWMIVQNGKQQVVEIEQWRRHNKGVVAKLVGVDTRDDAEVLKNLDILIEEATLPALQQDDFYWRDLVGMQVVTDQGYHLGTVKELFETGANDVMLVKANHNDAFGKKERMIPYLVERVVLHVDSEKRTVTVDWEPSF